MKLDDIIRTEHIPIKLIQIGSGVANHADSLVEELGLGKHLVVVSDENTHLVLGENLVQQLADNYKIDTVILPEGVQADDNAIAYLEERLNSCDAILAVGSGTVNDLCKHVSHKRQIPYVIFGTAPSMNGYASPTASLTLKGIKQSVSAHLPVAIILDSAILAASPKVLIQSGIGDSLCRSTAQADWLLSHRLLGTPYREDVFDWLLPYEQEAFAKANKIVKGNVKSMTSLAHLLVISGLGMAVCGGSYPASQGEHMIAHAMHMLGGDVPFHYHGQEIGVATLTMARLQEEILQQDILVIQPTIGLQSGDQDVDYYLQQMKEKEISSEQAETINQYLAKEWQNLKGEIQSKKLSAAELENILLSIDAPTQPNDLGWEAEVYQRVVQQTAYTRNRFTFLDLQQMVVA